MRSKTTFSLALVAALPLSIPSVQADDTGFYASAVAGLNLLGDQSATYRDEAVTSSTDRQFDAAFAAGGTIGYDFGPNWRAEAELMYRRNEQDGSVTLDGLGTFAEGDFASLSIAASVLYDFELPANPNLSPYVGAGLAFIQEIDVDFEDAGIETSFETDDIAVQLQAGVRYLFGERWFADAGLRYLVASDVELEFPDDTSRTVTSDYDPLTLSVGFGYRF
ncbi:MAG: porin family protein [Pseudomonadota bacterium]